MTKFERRSAREARQRPRHTSIILGLLYFSTFGGLVKRQLDNLKPVPAQRLHYFNEGVKTDGLCDEGIDPQVVSPINVLFSFRSGQDDDGYRPQIRRRLDLF